MNKRKAQGSLILILIAIFILGGGYLLFNKSGLYPLLPFSLVTLQPGADWQYPVCPTMQYQSVKSQYSSGDLIKSETSCSDGRLFSYKQPSAGYYKNHALYYLESSNGDCTHRGIVTCEQPVIIGNCAEGQLAKVNYDQGTFGFGCSPDPTYTTTSTTIPVSNLPSPPEKNSWIASVSNTIWGFIRGLFGFSISTTQTTYAPSSQASFTFSIPTLGSDSDISDGKRNVRYGLWYILDSTGKTIQANDWDNVVGDSYSKTVTLTIPNKVDSYYFVVNVINYDQTYVNGVWTTSEPTLFQKEVQVFKVEIPSAPVVTPMPALNWISNVWSSIWTWIFGLFGGKA